MKPLMQPTWEAADYTPSEDAVQLCITTAAVSPWAVWNTPTEDHTTEKGERLRPEVLVSVRRWPGQNPEHPFPEGPTQWEGPRYTSFARQ